jgi:hypothetical protein
MVRAAVRAQFHGTQKNNKKQLLITMAKRLPTQVIIAAFKDDSADAVAEGLKKA